MITSMNDFNKEDYHIGKVTQLLKNNIIHLDFELYEFINCYLNESQWSYLYENEIKHRINQLYVLVIPIHTIKKLQKFILMNYWAFSHSTSIDYFPWLITIKRCFLNLKRL